MKRIVISLSAMIFIIANIGLSQDIINETGKDGKFIVRDAEQKEALIIEDGNVGITGELSVEQMSEGTDSNPYVVWDPEDNKFKTVARVFSKSSPLSKPLGSNSWHSFGYGGVNEDGDEISASGKVLSWNQFNTDHGYIKLGPANDEAGHIYTDLPLFLFNKPVYSKDGSFSALKTNNLNLQTDGTTQVTILASNGNVGIGTDNPDEMLHIAGNMRLDGALEDKDGEAGSAGQILSSTATGTDWIAAPSGGTDTDWTISGSNMYSAVSGNVGIGTTNPDEKLHIAGNMRLDGTFEDKDGEAGSPGEILSSTGSGTDWIAASSGGMDGDWTISGDDMYSTVSGNVGIGTTSPSEKLEVDGNIVVNGALKYAAPRTYYYSLSPTDFSPSLISGSDVFHCSKWSAWMSSGTNKIYAPVHLPHGAVITGFTAFFWDASSDDLELTLSRGNWTDWGYHFIMASVSSFGSSEEIRNTSMSPVAEPTINNADYRYSIQVNPAWNASENAYGLWAYNLMVIGARITYTLGEAQ